MNNIIVSIIHNPYFNFMLSFITIASLIYAFFTNRANKKYKYLEHFELSKTIFRSNATKNPDLHLFYKDQEIPNITITNTAIWNAGNEAIKRDDLAQILTLYFDDANDIERGALDYINSILDVNIIGVTNIKNDINVAYCDSNKLEVDFNFLNSGDGLVIQILHTGYPLNLRIDSAVIGENKRKSRFLKKRKHRIVSRYHERIRGLSKKLSLSLCITSTIMTALWLIAKAFVPSALGDNQVDIIITTIMLILLLIASWTMLFLLKFDYYDRVPKEIRKMMTC